MSKKTLTVTDLEKAYAQYLKAFEHERDTVVGAMQKLAFNLQLGKGNKVTIGDVTFRADASLQQAAK